MLRRYEYFSKCANQTNDQALRFRHHLLHPCPQGYLGRMSPLIKTAIVLVVTAIALVRVILFAPVSPVLIAVTAVKDLARKVTGSSTESE
jgi:hypothetical protein